MAPCTRELTSRRARAARAQADRRGSRGCSCYRPHCRASRLTDLPGAQSSGRGKGRCSHGDTQELEPGQEMDLVCITAQPAHLPGVGRGIYLANGERCGIRCRPVAGIMALLAGRPIARPLLQAYSVNYVCKESFLGRMLRAVECAAFSACLFFCLESVLVRRAVLW